MITTEDRTVGQIVAENLALAQVFERHQIDYCCRGHRTLSEACADSGTPLETIEAELAATAPEATAVDWTTARLAKLIHYIVDRHHSYLRRTLPSVDEKLSKLVEAHAESHGAMLSQLRGVFARLRAELEAHMQKEELILFPAIARLEDASDRGDPPPAAPGGTVNNPIRMMVHEHDDAGAALRSLRSLSDNYAPPEDACTTFRALYAQLQEMEADLHSHIHLENSILFVRAAEMEERLATATR